MEQIMTTDDDERENRIHALLKERETLNINQEEMERATWGERLSDKLAGFAGSWRFIILFSLLLVAYIGINGLALLGKNYDPFPFVFLNFLLACIGSLQAPIIMMSQNREAKKDRIRADNDYLVNLKSEIILEDLHLKMDSIMEEIQEVNDTIAHIQVEETKRLEAFKP